MDTKNLAVLHTACIHMQKNTGLSLRAQVMAIELIFAEAAWYCLRIWKNNGLV